MVSARRCIDRIFASLWFTSSIFQIYNTFTAFFTENICAQVFAAPAPGFPVLLSFFFLGFGNDFHISKSYAQNEELE